MARFSREDSERIRDDGETACAESARREGIQPGKPAGTGKCRGAPTSFQIQERWLDMQVFERSTAAAPRSADCRSNTASIQLYSRDAGQRSAAVGIRCGAGDTGPRFSQRGRCALHCVPARKITLRVRDEHGEPTTAAFLFRDRQGRVNPSQAKRLAPDFGFHPQVYRADGETLRLPDGAYTRRVFARAGIGARNARSDDRATRTKELAFQVRALDRSGDRSAGGRAIITFTPPAARITRHRPKACMRRT